MLNNRALITIDMKYKDVNDWIWLCWFNLAPPTLKIYNHFQQRWANIWKQSAAHHSMQTVLFFLTLNEAWMGGGSLDIWQYWAAPLCFSLRWQWGQGLHRQLTVWHFNINVTFNLFLLSQTKVTHQNYSKNKPSKGKFHRFVKGRSFWYTRRATSHKVVLAGLRPTHHQTPILLSVLQTHQASKGRFCHTAPIHQNINYMQRFLVLNSQ